MIEKILWCREHESLKCSKDCELEEVGFIESVPALATVPPDRAQKGNEEHNE
jgi:hypothetical protein